MFLKLFLFLVSSVGLCFLPFTLRLDLLNVFPYTEKWGTQHVDGKLYVSDYNFLLHILFFYYLWLLDCYSSRPSVCLNGIY